MNTSKEYIELDYAGFRGYARYTHYPTGTTILRQPWMDSDDWQKVKSEYFAKYPGVRVQDEHGNEVTP